jgi:hypothetical protein
MQKTAPACVLAIVFALVPAVTALGCEAGGQDCPIPVHMKPGTDTITLRNTLRLNVDCCYYSFDASAGQTLTWDFKGPTDADSMFGTPSDPVSGPGVPNSIPLNETGTYVLGLIPNLMADNTLGPFELTVTIK